MADLQHCCCVAQVCRQLHRLHHLKPEKAMVVKCRICCQDKLMRSMPGW